MELKDVNIGHMETPPAPDPDDPETWPVEAGDDEAIPDADPADRGAPVFRRHT